jgi:hypothetical protein
MLGLLFRTVKLDELSTCNARINFLVIHFDLMLFYNQ